jgi:MFS family permease
MKNKNPDYLSPAGKPAPIPPAFQVPALPRFYLPIAEKGRVFRHRNFRLFFFGQLVSVVGTWMQSTALQWLVYQLTNSQSSLGLVTFLNFLPVLLISFFMGVLVDRLPKRKLLILTQSSFMILAITLAVLTFTGLVEYWHILALAFLVGIVNALDMPARQAFYVELVDREDLTVAIGLNSALFNSARIIGPAIAGLIVGWIGEAPAFAINAVTFLAVIFALLLMRVGSDQIQPARGKGFSDLLQGLRYLAGEKQIFGLVAMVALVSFVGAPYMVLLPVFARDILQIGAEGFGQLMAAHGIGALIGALGVIFFGSRLGRGNILISARALMGLAVFALAVSPYPWLSMVALALAGYAYITQLILTNTLIQGIVPDALRGRVMSAFTWALGGFFPLGSLLIGVIGDQIGAQNAAILISLGCLVLTAVNLVVFPAMKEL